MQSSFRELEKRYTRLSDRGLLHVFLVQTDHEAFAEIVRRYQWLVMSVCRRVSGNREDAEDAFQATFIALAHRPKQLRKAASLGTWLYSVAWRTSVRAVRLKRKRMMQPIPEDITTASSETEFEAISRDRDLIVLNEELNQLPNQYRVVLVMNYFIGHNNQQIADELQVTKGTIDGRIRRAKNALRVRLARRGVTMAAFSGVAAIFVDSASAAPHQLIDQTITSGSCDSAGHQMSAQTSAVRQLAQPECGGITWPVGPLLVLSTMMLAGMADWHNDRSYAAVGGESIVLNAMTEPSDPASAQAMNDEVEVRSSDTIVESTPDSAVEPDDAHTPTETEIRKAAEDRLLSAEGDWGGISGQIIFDGPLPKRQILHRAGAVLKDQAVCGVVDLYDESLLVNSKNKGIANCFVYLRKADQIHPNLKNPPQQLKILDQKKCQFAPHAMFLRVGQTLGIASSDPIAHNIHPMPLRNQPIHCLVPPSTGGKVAIRFTPTVSELLPIEVRCHLHPWMQAYWLILDHPYAAITDADGRFRIVGLPAGLHKLRIWHERTGYIDREYKVIAPKGEIREHKPVRVPADRFEN